MKKYIPIIDEKDVDAFLSIFRNIAVAEVQTAKHEQLVDFEIVTVRTKYPIMDTIYPVMDTIGNTEPFPDILSVTPAPPVHE